MFLTDGRVATEIRKLFFERRPHKIIETGTFMGEGSTKIIATAIRDFDLPARFITIECNPGFAEAARNNLRVAGLNQYVQVVNALSIPRVLLPTHEKIMEWLHVQPAHLFDDLQKERNGINYIAETGYAVPEDYLRTALESFFFEVDFVLLDSAGYVGYTEFIYLLDLLKNPCVIALDDALTHVKHYDSVKFALSDSRFKHLVSVDERYGFVMLEFNPGA